ncbi:hypothetical protein NDU88_003617 [Pleurodeles waltl]|uniref:Uncharacterized protein n=1 Tax=Pleurodeles waltl TaxID=8319 RepID=A0AAV7W6P2_PLEWA|nr:hypothetical protein NDU88_003617 [Pleurodeles waltl]
MGLPEDPAVFLQWRYGVRGEGPDGALAVEGGRLGERRAGWLQRPFWPVRPHAEVLHPRRWTRPYKKGGFEVPDLEIYYLTAQCRFVKYWYHSDGRLPFLVPEREQTEEILLTFLFTGNYQDP